MSAGNYGYTSSAAPLPPHTSAMPTVAMAKKWRAHETGSHGLTFFVAGSGRKMLDVLSSHRWCVFVVRFRRCAFAVGA